MHSLINRSRVYTALFALGLAFLLYCGLKAGETSTGAASNYYNRANAFARTGKTGSAILNYERARLLAPGDGDVASNERTARTQGKLPEMPVSRIEPVFALASPNAFAWLGIAGLYVACASALLLKLGHGRRGVLGVLIGAGIFCTLLSAGDAFFIRPTTQEAVVMVSESAARSSPATVAENVFMLQDGQTVTVKAERSDFALVEAPSGQVGWVARTDLERVIVN